MALIEFKNNANNTNMHFSLDTNKLLKCARFGQLAIALFHYGRKALYDENTMVKECKLPFFSTTYIQYTHTRSNFIRFILNILPHLVVFIRIPNFEFSKICEGIILGCFVLCIPLIFFLGIVH